MSRGYFLIARGTLDHPRFKPDGPFSNFEAWCWLIEAAAHGPRDVAVANGRQRKMVHLEPGQLTFSVRFLAKAWSWSDKRVQRFLSALVRDQSVTTQTTTGQTLITLCNWRKYQRPAQDATTQTATRSATQTTTQMTTKKEELKELNEFNDDEGTRERAPAKPIVSAETKAAVALGLAFLKAAGFEDYSAAPPNWYRVSERAEAWIAAGWSEGMITAETRIVTERAGTTMPIAYYEKVFATAAARAAQPVPTATVKPAENVDVIRPSSNRSTSNAFAKLRERLEQGHNVVEAGRRLAAEALERERAMSAECARVVCSSSSAGSNTVDIELTGDWLLRPPLR